METITKFLADQEAERERVWEDNRYAPRCPVCAKRGACDTCAKIEAEQLRTIGRIEFKSTKAKRRD